MQNALATQEFQVPSIGIETLPNYFICPRHVGALTLSTEACSRLWGRANGRTAPEREEEIYKCRGCAIGAKNSGQPCQESSELLDIFTHRCARCFRPAQRFIHKTKCVSCFNREREVVLNRNGKGVPPKHLLPVPAMQVAFLTEDRKTARVAHLRVANEIELIISVMKRTGARFFCKRSGTPMIQLSEEQLVSGQICIKLFQ